MTPPSSPRPKKAAERGRCYSPGSIFQEVTPADPFSVDAGVPVGPAVEEVDALATAEVDVAGLAVERVVAVTAACPVVAAAGQDGVVASERVEAVVVRVAGERVAERAPVELLDPRQRIFPVSDRCPSGKTCRHGPGRVEVRGCVPAGAAVDGVIARASRQVVIAVVARDGVVSVTALHPVVAAAGHDGVVAAERVEAVVARVPGERVAEWAPVDLLDPAE